MITEENKALYAERSNRFDMVLDLRFTGEGLDALCRVLEAWVRHFLDVAVTIQPVRAIDDDHWIWHSGLDGESSAILNDLYDGKPVDDDAKQRILALFELRIPDASVMLPAVAGRPIYLGLAMTPANRLTRLLARCKSSEIQTHRRLRFRATPYPNSSIEWHCHLGQCR